MADDGLVVNFDFNQQPFSKPLASFKGGSWKDRLTAKKAAQRYHEKNVQYQHPQPEELILGGEIGSGPLDILANRATKRQRIGISNGVQKGTQNAAHNRGPRQVISSLFSFNPESKGQDEVDKQIQEEPDAEPSNAPLKSELDTFTSLGLSASLAEHLLKKMEITAPTAIQKAAVTQLVKEDSDAFLQAETGSGKTLAYLLPIVQRIISLSTADPDGVRELTHRDSGLFAIILGPTRELCKQIQVVLESLLRCAHWIVSGTVIGGEKKKSEKARLRKGLNILIATPGRLADHLDHTEVLNVSNVRWLVLDEGDRLMEMGFENDLEKILQRLKVGLSKTTRMAGLPNKRVTVLCSATMKMNVQKLGELSLKDAVHIQGDGEHPETNNDANKADKGFSAPAQLRQSYAIVPAKQRLVSLAALLKRTFARRGSVMKAIVFLACADSVDFHFELFIRKDQKMEPEPSAIKDNGKKLESPAMQTSGIATTFSSKDNPVKLFRLHGSLPQAIRTSTLAAFRQCKQASALICTDVAARGLDVPDIDFVVEYDPPFIKDDHLHRVGRTARAGKEGRAMIFLLPGSEEGYVDVLKDGKQEGGLNSVRHNSDELLKRGFGSTDTTAGKDWEDQATDWQLDVERWVADNPRHLEQARNAYQSHIRAYATHVSAERKYFDMQALHLGHLAKAFALRDKPGNIRVPGLRPTAAISTAAKIERRAMGSRKNQSADVMTAEVTDFDVQEAARMMKRKSKMQAGGASEFNLG